MWLWTKEAAVGIVRTVMPYIWAWLLTALAGWEWIMQFSFGELALNWINGIDPLQFVVPAGTIIYGLIRQLAEKFPWVGYFLVFNKKPSYDLS